jgi:hypothetical protein
MNLSKKLNLIEKDDQNEGVKSIETIAVWIDDLVKELIVSLKDKKLSGMEAIGLLDNAYQLKNVMPHIFSVAEEFDNVVYNRELVQYLADKYFPGDAKAIEMANEIIQVVFHLGIFAKRMKEITSK